MNQHARASVFEKRVLDAYVVQELVAYRIVDVRVEIEAVTANRAVGEPSCLNDPEGPHADNNYPRDEKAEKVEKLRIHPLSVMGQSVVSLLALMLSPILLWYECI